MKQEIEKGLGTQFNPKWGKIMLELIEKDKDYKMHQYERGKKAVTRQVSQHVTAFACNKVVI